MKTSSSLNTPQMSAVRSQLASQEASMLDGALAELQHRRELERMMSERAAEAHRQQQLIQAARDAEREMIQHLAEEAATQRRAEHELAVATADQDDLSNEAHRAIGALPPKTSRGSLMSSTRSVRSVAEKQSAKRELEEIIEATFDKESEVSDVALPAAAGAGAAGATELGIRALEARRMAAINAAANAAGADQAVKLMAQGGNPLFAGKGATAAAKAERLRAAARLVVADRRKVALPAAAVLGAGAGYLLNRQSKESQVRDAALVGYSAPGMGDREVYLESRAPTASDRFNRALMGGGGGAALGALGGAAATLLGRGRSGTRNALMGALGGGGLGALAGAAAPMSVRTAYDPDYGTQLSEREERRAAAVHRALQAGSQPSNIAMQQPGTRIAARPFGGQAPTFSYAADIDDMVREDPAMAQALMGKMSAAPRKTEAHDNAPGLKGEQRTMLPDQLQRGISRSMTAEEAADRRVMKARARKRYSADLLRNAKRERRFVRRTRRDQQRLDRRYKVSSPYGIDRSVTLQDGSTLRLVTGTADHPRAAERAALQRSADANLTGAQVHALFDVLTGAPSGYAGLSSAQAQRDMSVINAIDSYSPKGRITSTRSRTPEEYAQAVQELYEANRSANTAGGAVLGGFLGGLGGRTAGALRAAPRAGLGGLLGLGGGAALGGVLGRIATNKSPAAGKTVTDTVYRGRPEDALLYAQENYPDLTAGQKVSAGSPVTRTRGGVKSAYEKAKRDGKKKDAGRRNSPHGHRREE